MRVLALVLALVLAPAHAQLRAPDVRYEPSLPPIVEAMLQLGEVRANDLVYDLGCGDGRVVIAAARERGARGVCVDIDPLRIAQARRNAELAGVTDRIRFVNADLFQTDFSDATVVMLFLWPDVNLKLRPKLRGELKAGARVVSHWHDMGDWKPDRVVQVESAGRERPVYLWILR